MDKNVHNFFLKRVQKNKYGEWIGDKVTPVNNSRNFKQTNKHTNKQTNKQTNIRPLREILICG